MANAHATLSNFRQAPRKMRLVANTVRGKKVADVLTNLDVITKKASLPLKTLIQSALSNAKNLGIPTENLIVKVIKVDSGKILYRRRPVSRGRAHPIRKRTSSIYIELGEQSKEIRKNKVTKEAKVEVLKTKTAVRKTKSKKSGLVSHIS